MRILLGLAWMMAAAAGLPAAQESISIRCDNDEAAG